MFKLICYYEDSDPSVYANILGFDALMILLNMERRTFGCKHYKVSRTKFERGSISVHRQK